MNTSAWVMELSMSRIRLVTLAHAVRCPGHLPLHLRQALAAPGLGRAERLTESTLTKAQHLVIMANNKTKEGL